MRNVSLGVLATITTALLIWHQPLVLAKQPFPDAHEYLNAAYRLAHGHGYTTTVKDNLYSPHIHQAVNPPRFPPGTSLVLAPFALVGTYPGNIEFGIRLIAVALVIATGWAAFVIAGWYAALLAAFVTSISQFVLLNTQIVMSDTLAALLIVICLPLLKRHARWSVYLLGLIAGYGFVIRESGVVVVACVLIALTGWDRLRAAMAAAVPILGLAIYNWATFGAPWRTGQSYWLGSFRLYSLSYAIKHPWSPGGEEFYAFSLRIFHLVGGPHTGFISLIPNIWFYPLILLGFSTVFGPPWFTALGLIGAAWSWRKPEALFTLLLAGLTVIFYMPIYGQDPRYLAGPCLLLTAWAAAAVVRIARIVRYQYGRQILDVLAPTPETRAARGDITAWRWLRDH